MVVVGTNAGNAVSLLIVMMRETAAGTAAGHVADGIAAGMTIVSVVAESGNGTEMTMIGPSIIATVIAISTVMPSGEIVSAGLAVMAISTATTSGGIVSEGSAATIDSSNDGTNDGSVTSREHVRLDSYLAVGANLSSVLV